MAFYGPPMMPMSMPASFPPRRRAPKKRPQQKKQPKPQPKPLNDQQKTAVAKEAIAKATTVPMPPMAPVVKTSLRTQVIKGKRGELQDARGRLTQSEINQLYFQIATALNSGLGEIGIHNAATQEGVRLIVRLNLAPPNSIAEKLYKSHAAAHLNSEALESKFKERESDPLFHFSTTPE
ncbi:putative nucleocapsid protein [Chinook salmon bafinivirus]|uniref:Putative nucleocapsid protein n=1 Tax=Chinook salmon bafinivirus TaxID=1611837 RepID=A0A0E3J9S7_9NIDO|nr:putative nucleocapsid protein [Chinook salmon bafinivirus]AJO67759.1 putative nucleocapsid protein [Chinook salmon bafinivirus]AUE23864.1 putative nucleoprotein [Atlantic salmon bafinivirus]